MSDDKPRELIDVKAAKREIDAVHDILDVFEGLTEGGRARVLLWMMFAMVPDPRSEEMQTLLEQAGQP